MEQYRNSSGIQSFILAHRRSTPHISSLKLFAIFLNDSNPDLIKKRAVSLYSMLLGWHSLMKIDMENNAMLNQ